MLRFPTNIILAKTNVVSIVRMAGSLARGLIRIPRLPPSSHLSEKPASQGSGEWPTRNHLAPAA